MSHFVISLLVIGSHVGIPLVLLTWLALSRPSTQIHWIVQLLLVGSLLAYLILGGAGWAWVTVSVRYCLPFLFLGAAGFSWYRNWGRPPLVQSPLRYWLSLILLGAGAVVVSFGVVTLLSGRSYRGEAVRLSFPLRDGSYYIVQGGSTAALNAHAVVAAQTYALDIVKLGSWGRRASGLYPKDISRYAIFGANVYAPCTGNIVSSRDDLVDLPPSMTDRKTPAGNHLIVHCQGITVVLAHLKKGSLLVKAGQSVQQGQLLGQVGNSGNTSEPHLHIHAARGELTDLKTIASSAEPVPMLFNERFLVRNDCVIG